MKNLIIVTRTWNFIMLVNTKYYCVVLTDTDFPRNITARKMEKIAFCLALEFELFNVLGKLSVWWQRSLRNFSADLSTFMLVSIYSCPLHSHSRSGADLITCSSLAVSEQWHMILLSLNFFFVKVEVGYIIIIYVSRWLKNGFYEMFNIN